MGCRQSCGPPPLPRAASSAGGRKLVAILLSLFLVLFLANGVVSALDDAWVLLFGNHLLNLLNSMVTAVTVLLTIVLYGLMGLTPVIPKRIVLPAASLIALSALLSLPVAIYHYEWMLPFDLLASCAMVVLALGIIFGLQGGFKLPLPLVSEKQLGTKAFSWQHLAAFLLLNIFGLLPAVLVYLGGCSSLAMSHFTDGFVSMRPGGIVMHVRKYIRADGKTVVLFPMSHIAESDFYQNVRQSIGTNSVVLLEGVTDTNNLLTHRLSYQRAAKFLHLAEQHYSFSTNTGKSFRADVDVSNFSSNTIVLLNLVTLVHSEGVNAHTISLLLECSPSEESEQELLDDLLLKRNQHVLEVLQARLPEADNFVIPWGAAHMAGLAREIQKSGFRLEATRDVVSIRFWGKENTSSTGWIQRPENSR